MVSQPGAPPDWPGRPTPSSNTAASPDSALIAASVRLRVEDPTGRSCGSGTIIDSRGGEALVLTCGHIFRDSNGKGRIEVDLFSNPAQEIAGRLVSYDLTRDVGLVAIRPAGPVATARLAPPGYRIGKGQAVVNVGCNNGAEPTARHSQVIDLNKFQGPPNIEVSGQPAEGRSGGGLFTSEGYVIGVCNAADPADREGLFVALEAICAQLDQDQLAFVYKRRKAVERRQRPIRRALRLLGRRQALASCRDALSWQHQAPRPDRRWRRPAACPRTSRRPWMKSAAA